MRVFGQQVSNGSSWYLLSTVRQVIDNLQYLMVSTMNEDTVAKILIESKLVVTG